MISIASHVKSSLSDEGAVLLDSRRGRYLSLNGVAATIWEGIRAGHDLSVIRKALVTRYEVTEDVAETDLVTFVSRLRSEGLIQGSEAEALGSGVRGA